MTENHNKEQLGNILAINQPASSQLLIHHPWVIITALRVNAVLTVFTWGALEVSFLNNKEMTHDMQMFFSSKSSQVVQEKQDSSR
jgi:hypothetical protein